MSFLWAAFHEVFVASDSSHSSTVTQMEVTAAPPCPCLSRASDAVFRKTVASDHTTGAGGSVENSRWHKSSLSLLHREGYGGRLENEGYSWGYGKAFLLLGNGVKRDMSRARRKCYSCICWDPCLLALTCQEELHVYIKRTFPLLAVNQPNYLFS